MMNRSRRPVRLPLLIVVLAALPVVLAAQLNPTVKVLPGAAGSASSECDQSLTPQATPRIVPEEKTVIRDASGDMKAPPSANLRAELRTTFDAAEHGNRDFFRDALSRSKQLLGGYPPGGERTAASDVIAVFDDLDKLWNYEFTSPTGAFFDSGSDVFRIVNKYPGYDAFIRKQIIVDRNGNRFYATRESRDFLVREAADRVARVTGRPVATRPPAHETITETEARRRTAPPPAPKAATRTPTEHRPVTHEARATKPPAPRTHRTETRTTKRVGAPSKKTSKSPKPAMVVATTTHAKPKPAPPPPPVTTTHAKPTPAPPPPPVTTTHEKPKPAPPPPVTTTHAEETATTETLAMPTPPIVATTETAATTSSAQPTTNNQQPTTSAQPTTDYQQPSTTSTSASTATTTTATTATSERKSFFIPILLIIVGLGVLVLLFRASS